MRHEQSRADGPRILVALVLALLLSPVVRGLTWGLHHSVHSLRPPTLGCMGGACDAPARQVASTARQPTR